MKVVGGVPLAGNAHPEGLRKTGFLQGSDASSANGSLQYKDAGGKGGAGGGGAFLKEGWIKAYFLMETKALHNVAFVVWTKKEWQRLQ